MQNFFHVLLEVLEEACLDALKALPILFCVYVLVSYFSHNSHKHLNFFKKAEKFGPIVGSTVGVIPQCGFSVAMADLYNKKNISLGTLIAVFIATSDEAIPLLFSNYNFFVPMLVLIAIKFVYAIICGYIIDCIMQLFHKKRKNAILVSPIPHEACECGHEEHDHEHTHYCCADNIFIDAIKHTLKIAFFILIINIIMGVIIETSGINLNAIANFNPFVQPLITSFVGLIPNCVASVLLVEIYMAGGITFGSMVAGLCTGAGLGLLMLFKGTKRSILKCFGIVGIVYLLGIIAGIILNVINLSF